MTDNDLIAAGWIEDIGAWSHPDIPGMICSRSAAVKRATAVPCKPRPTCGTCPLWEPDEHDRVHDGRMTRLGDCRADQPNHEYVDSWRRTSKSSWCGQHPDMSDWITNEWPKVRAGR